MLRSSRPGTTGRGSFPQARSCRCAPATLPTAAWSVGTSVSASSATVVMPHRASARSVLSPTPHSAPTGSVRTKATVAPAGTSIMPSGLACVDASLATNLFRAIPTEHVMPCSVRTRSRRRAPIAVGLPRRRRAPPTSRNASSTETRSTSAVISENIPMTDSETSW